MASRHSVLDGILGVGADDGGTQAITDVLFDARKSHLKMITDIPPDLVYPLSVLTVVAGKYHSSVLDKFISEFYQLQISRDRKGRGELIEALLATRSGVGDDLGG